MLEDIYYKKISPALRKRMLLKSMEDPDYDVDSHILDYFRNKYTKEDIISDFEQDFPFIRRNNWVNELEATLDYIFRDLDMDVSNIMFDYLYHRILELCGDSIDGSVEITRNHGLSIYVSLGYNKKELIKDYRKKYDMLKVLSMVIEDLEKEAEILDKKKNDNLLYKYLMERYFDEVLALDFKHELKLLGDMVSKKINEDKIINKIRVILSSD